LNAVEEYFILDEVWEEVVFFSIADWLTQDPDFKEKDSARWNEADNQHEVARKAVRRVVWDKQNCDLNSKTEIENEHHQLGYLEHVKHEEILVNRNEETLEFRFEKQRECSLCDENGHS